MTRTLFGFRFSLFVFTAFIAAGSLLAQQGGQPAAPAAPATAPAAAPAPANLPLWRTAMRSRARHLRLRCRRRPTMGHRRRCRAAPANSRSRRFAMASVPRTGIRAITRRCPTSSRAAGRTATFARARSATIRMERGVLKMRRCRVCPSLISFSRCRIIATAPGRAQIRRKTTPTR